MASDLDAPVRYETRKHVAILTLNRPQALNAVNSALSHALGAALERAIVDDEVRVVVVTGAGRAFCAGADLKELARGNTVHDSEHPEWDFAGFVRHWCDKPTIAAVNGFAMGGGTELALACDLVVAGEDVSFGLPEVKRGLFAAAGGAVRLQRQIPLKIALQVALTGDPMSAPEALRWGLVNAVTPPGEALEHALELAERISANAPLSVQATKRVMHETALSGADWFGVAGELEQSAWGRSNDAMASVFDTEDAHEGATAFAEKRPPVWRGR